MKRDIILATIGLVIVLGAILYATVLHPSPAQAPPVSGTTSTTTTAFAVPLKSPYSEHAPYYDIEANYATSTVLAVSVSAEADAAATALMRSFVSNQIAQFKKEGRFDSLTPEDIKMLGFDSGRKYTLNIAYLISTSKRSVSYIFTVNTYTGGAHGATTFKTFTFDAQTGKLLTLGDLFTKGADYLGKLSTISRTRLPGALRDQADADMIVQGTTPREENFANFFLDNANIVILFEPYQVAAYAAGPQTLYIGLSELATILKSEYKY